MDQNLWVIQIRERLEYFEEEEKLESSGVSVFNVPKELVAMKAEAYIPQAVSIGPYHHCKSELYKMERYKVAAARRARKRLNGEQKFDLVVGEFQKLDWRIRSFYHKYIDYDGETLAWLMAVDACFVLERLEFCVDGEFIEQLGGGFHPMPRSVAHNGIARDMMMLENQIPLFLLEKLLEMQLDSKQKAEEKLCILANGACTALSPFTFASQQISIGNVRKRAHILELLYYALVPIVPLEFDENEATPETEVEAEAESVNQNTSSVWTAFSSLNVGPVQRLLRFGQRVLKAKPLQLITKLPWRSLWCLVNSPLLRTRKGPLGSILRFVTPCNKNQVNNSQDDAEGSSSQCEIQGIPPSPDELLIPSVSDLYHAGIKFQPTDGDLTSLHFDEKAVTLYLPRITLDTNTEVVLRNLMAFEACAAPGALVFRRYIDLMNGIIDTEEDVCMLRNCGIISNHLRNDKEVANLWNSLGRCATLSKLQCLDKVVVDLNKYYRNRWNVAVAQYVNKYIFRSWKCLSLLAALLLLIFDCLGAFCSVYKCREGTNYNFYSQLSDHP